MQCLWLNFELPAQKMQQLTIEASSTHQNQHLRIEPLGRWATKEDDHHIESREQDYSEHK